MTLDGQDVTERVFTDPILTIHEGREVQRRKGRFLGEAADHSRQLPLLLLVSGKAHKQQQDDLADGKGTRADEVMRIEQRLFEVYAQPQNADLPEEIKKRGGAYYSDVALSTISAMVNNRPVVEALNVRNRGAVPGVSPDSIVEVSSMVDGRGPHPIAQNPLPREVLGLVQQVKAYEDLTVEAAVKGDPEAAFFALLNHPLVPGADKALALLKDILEANKDYLPQFAGCRI